MLEVYKCVILIIMEQFNTLVAEASHILDIVENYQWELGRIANEVVTDFGYRALTDFSKQIESTGGVRRSAGTLRMYAYVWKIANQLNLPKDILFSACQNIVFSNDPKKYAEMVKNGASGTDVRKAIYNDKYVNKE